MLIKYTDNEVDLCARLMRAEALSEGNLGMLMVGNVIVNRALADCLDFKNIRTVTDAIYQKNQFSGINSSLFYQRANIIIQLQMLCGFIVQKQMKVVKVCGLIKS